MFRLEYGYQKGLREKLLEDKLAAEFLRRFKPGTQKSYGEDLSIFFRWLHVKKGLDLSPTQFLKLHKQKRLSDDLEDNRWALSLALEFTRDNPDFAERSGSHKYSLFSVIRSFCRNFEADLTTSENAYGKRGSRKYHPKQMSSEVARKVIGILPQREKTICMIMLQSGMSIGDVLNKFSFEPSEKGMCSGLSYVKACLADANLKRLRVDIRERKGNGFSYFTFISQDAIQELRKWLTVREGIAQTHKAADSIFIKNNGGVFDLYDFEGNFGYHVERAKLWTGPWSLSSHMFRKLFKTESRPPERGVDQDCVEFLMGHLSGIESVGGVYDRTPELAPEVIEREYAKLEAFLNVFSNPSRTSGVSDAERKILDAFRDDKFYDWFMRLTDKYKREATSI